MGKIGYKRRKNMPYKKNKRIEKLNEKDKRDPNVERSATHHYPDWDKKDKKYIVPPKVRRNKNV